MPCHRIAEPFAHVARDGRYSTTISAGAGSAPDFRCETRTTSERSLPASFAPFFESWRSAVSFLCLQHGAIARVEDCHRLAYAAIDLPVDIDSVEPIAALDLPNGTFLQDIGETGEPFCFRVPHVPFRVLSERLL
jgi:hypothetical protein